MGKFVVALIAITLVLVCSTLAYGTGEDDALPLADTSGAPSEEMQPAEGDDPSGDATVVADEDAEGDEATGEEGATDDPAEGEETDADGEEGTEEEPEEEAVEPGMTRVTFVRLDEAPVTVRGLEKNTLEISEGNEGQALEFILLPDVCNTITAAKATITAAVEAPEAAAASEPVALAEEADAAAPAEDATDATTPQAPAATEGAVEEKELTLEDPDKDDLKDNPYAKKLVIPAADLVGAAEVAITLQTEERDMNWFDIVQACAEGEDITLEDDVVVDDLTVADLTIEAAPAVVDGKAVTLDLNGHKIFNKKTDLNWDALFVVNGGSLTITDPNAGASFGGHNIGAASPENAGTKGSYSNNGDITVTYYETYTTSTDKANASTTETLAERTVTIPASVGAVEGNGSIGSLVSVEGGTFALQGGRLTNGGSQEIAGGNGTGRAIKANGGTVAITDGFIVGNQLIGSNGAGICADGATVMLEGNAVVAGNSVQFNGEENSGNGGGIYAASSTVTVGGNAVVAVNKATEVNTGTAWTTKGDRPANQNGGGLYLTASNATVWGNALIASNGAQHDGGGIYCATGSDELALAGAANVTNNHTLVRPDKYNENVKDNWATIGGGGICSSGLVTIDGASINGNRSADAGGGLLMPQLNNKVTATLKMNDGVVACNVAETDEGGGMYLFTTGYKGNGDPSYINAGFITNNETKTSFGYGGGGIFIANASPNHGYVNVVNPLVTHNTAEGQGGGIAGCKNGMMVTNDAAIFENTANESKSTDHSAGIGDNWGVEINQKLNEGESEAVNFSNDYYNAGESTVYANMLGGGASNWTGYMSYKPQTLKAYKSANWKEDATYSLDGNSIFSGKGHTMVKPGGLANLPEDVFRMSVKNVSEDEVKAFIASVQPVVYVDFQRVNSFTLKGTAVVATDLERDDKGDVKDGYRTDEDGGVTYYHIYFKKVADASSAPTDRDGNVYNGYLKDKDDKFTTEGLEFGAVYNLTETIWGTQQTHSGDYIIAKINRFPEETATDPKAAKAKAYSGRIMALTADPSKEAKEAAQGKAQLCIGGNRSNTNGGGIACNGFTHIGQWMPPDDPPPVPEEEPKAKLNITKSFDGFSPDAGTATVIFNIAGYRNAQWDRSDPFYENTITMTFDPNVSMEAQTYTLSKPFDPTNYFVIEEVAFAGSNYTGQTTWEGTLRDAGRLAPGGFYQIVASFENAFNDDNTFGTGAVNRYTGENGTYTYKEKISTSTWKSETTTDDQ